MLKPEKQISEILEEDENTAIIDSVAPSSKNSVNIDFNARIKQPLFSKDLSKEKIPLVKENSKSNSKSTKSSLKFQNTIAGTKFNSRFDIDLVKRNKEQFRVEELLVIYYVSIVIRLSKLSDGKKAINEYNKKKGISKQAEAHIFKILGVLNVLGESKDYQKALNFFKKAIENFESINAPKGLAISNLALLR